MIRVVTNRDIPKTNWVGILFILFCTGCVLALEMALTFIPLLVFIWAIKWVIS